ncbi:MAG: phospholipase, partial [Acidobacteriaceae bacterium]|nr:phospholipase [Acidobacteriaceae bacterium]
MSNPVAVGLATAFLASLAVGQATAQTAAGASKPTATPVKHLVVIFDENISFDHYFGTYPNALNPPHEPAFKALPGTPSVNGLTPTLLQRNPNFLNVKVNGDYAVNPIRLGPKQAFTA